MPAGLLIDLLLGSLIYAILALITFRLARRNSSNSNRDDNDDDDGGIWCSDLPLPDLPPGVTLPDDTPKEKKREESELAVV